MFRGVAQTRWSEACLGRNRYLSLSGFEPGCAHNAQRQRGAVVERLLNLRQNRERNRGGCLRAEVKAGGRIDGSQPLLDLTFGGGETEQACGFGQHFARAALGAEHADIRERRTERQQHGENSRVLFEAVRHHDRSVAGAQVETRRGRAGKLGDVEDIDLACRWKTVASGEMRSAIGYGDEPAEFPRKAKQRLCVVARTKDPQAGARGPILGPDAARLPIEANLTLRGRLAPQRTISEEPKDFFGWQRSGVEVL